MKRIATTLLLTLFFVSSAFAVQTKPANTAPAEKAHKASTTTAVDDTTITTSVKEKLTNTPSLKTANINVDTKAGVVTLTGEVKNAGLKGVATNVTKRCKGVKRVVNQINIEKGKATAPGHK